MTADRSPTQRMTDRALGAGLRLAARHDRLAFGLDRVLAPFNLFTPARHTDPYPRYEELRAHGPVFHHRRAGLWLVSGYDESVAFLRAPLSAARLETFRHQHPYRRMRSDNLDLMAKAILMSDPPEHTRLRRTVSRAFTPRAVDALAPRIGELTNELLDDVARAAGRSASHNRPVDLMATFAERLPVFVIAEMLGVPQDQREELKVLSDQVSAFVEPFVGFDHREMDAAIDRIRALFGGLAADRQHRPGPDVISTMATNGRCPIPAETRTDTGTPKATVALDAGLDRDELVAMAMLLLIAGNETTSGLIGNSIIALHRHPGARRRLIADPSTAADAVDELIRFDSPVQVTDRIAVDDIEIAGHRLPGGSTVVVLLGAANRDPRSYDRPNELLLDRPSPRPLSFGHGIHHCLGAALARLQTSIALQAIAERFPDLLVVDSGVVWKRSMSLRGADRLPVTIHG